MRLLRTLKVFQDHFPEISFAIIIIIAEVCLLLLLVCMIIRVTSLSSWSSSADLHIQFRISNHRRHTHTQIGTEACSTEAREPRKLFHHKVSFDCKCHTN